MPFGEKCGSNVTKADEVLVRSTSFGRKRVFLSNLSIECEDGDDCIASTPSKRRCFRDSFSREKKSAIEDLPQEILIRILCGVEHDDLKRLFFVSKALREATLVAKQSHFAYSTPRKTGFQNFELFGDFDEIEAPNAPKQLRNQRSRLSAKKMAEISIALFPSGDKAGWPRREIFLEMETED